MFYECDVIDMDILCDACADWVELKVSTGIHFGACISSFFTRSACALCTPVFTELVM